jgi:Protein of unknown function (DUF2752)
MSDLALRAPVGRRLAAPAGSAFAAAVAVTLLAVRDPHTSGSYGHCPFLAVTGLPCPLCGGLRAVADLAHGQVRAALLSNALVVVLVIGSAVVWTGWTVRRGRGRGHEAPPFTSDPRLGRWVGLAMLLFCLVRWLPGFSGLRPS